MARQKSTGTIGDVEVTIITEGPVAQELEDDKLRGSDNIHTRLKQFAGVLKRDVEREPDENECPACDGDGFLFDGLNEFYECSECGGAGVKA
jgi:hypothetical protein